MCCWAVELEGDFLWEMRACVPQHKPAMLIHLVASLILCRSPSVPISKPACLPASNACLNALNARLPVHACPLQSVWEVEQVVANYSQAGLPLEAIWTDVRGAGQQTGWAAG